MPDDTDEVLVLAQIVRKLDALQPSAQKRLLRYLLDRFDPITPIEAIADGTASTELRG